MESSSLHGVQYIAEDGRHWSERLIWTFFVILGFIITFVFIWPIWIKYQRSPTITSIGSTNFPIWEVRHPTCDTLSNKLNFQINFPGVTICPSNKVVETKLDIMKQQSPWLEEITQFGPVNFDKLLQLLTGFKNIPKERWNDFDELEGVINRIGQQNLTILMQKVNILIGI